MNRHIFNSAEEEEELLRGLSDQYMYDVLQRKQKTRYFVGVFARDEIPFLHIFSLVERSGKAVTIVNLDKSSQNGSHWITISFTEDRIDYYDSLGVNMQNSFELYKILHTSCPEHDIRLVYCQAIQHADSRHCGFFAMHAAMRQDESFACVQVTPFLMEPTLVNDCIVIDNIEKMIVFRGENK